MKIHGLVLQTLLPAVILGGCASVPSHAPASAASSKYKAEVSGAAEEIFIRRTVRSSHQRGATPGCSAAPFTSVNEDVYDLWSIATEAKDGRIVDSHVAPVGSFLACFGPLERGKPLLMYAKLSDASGLSYTGVGECLGTTAQPPVSTLLGLNCSIKLSDLPSEYAGGLAVSSSLAPALGRDQPADAYVPGYLSTSVLIVRLWKKPK